MQAANQQESSRKKPCNCVKVWKAHRYLSEGQLSLWQGHIALDSAVFPTGTPGLALDTLARAPLWSMGLNYRHGTGHGVGAALNVHEGPQSISTRCGGPHLPALFRS